MKPIFLRIAYTALGLTMGVLLGSMGTIEYLWPHEVLYRNVWTVYFAYAYGCEERSKELEPNKVAIDYCFERAALRARDLMTIYDKYDKQQTPEIK